MIGSVVLVLSLDSIDAHPGTAIRSIAESIGNISGTPSAASISRNNFCIYSSILETDGGVLGGADDPADT
jgi:hypothetical protein